MSTSSLAGYHSNSRKIIITGGGGNNRSAYVFDLNLKSWTYMKDIFHEVMTFLECLKMGFFRF